MSQQKKDTTTSPSHQQGRQEQQFTTLPHPAVRSRFRFQAIGLLIA
jgi:hypothetical protein